MHFRFGTISENLRHPWKIWSMDNYSSPCLQAGNTHFNSAQPQAFPSLRKNSKSESRWGCPFFPTNTPAGRIFKWEHWSSLLPIPTLIPQAGKTALQSRPYHQSLPPSWLQALPLPHATSLHILGHLLRSYYVHDTAPGTGGTGVSETDTIPALQELITQCEKKLMPWPCQ